VGGGPRHENQRPTVEGRGKKKKEEPAFKYKGGGRRSLLVESGGVKENEESVGSSKMEKGKKKRSFDKI